jgi:hypothetical protein
MHNLTTPIFAYYVMLWTLVDDEPIHPLGQAEDDITWTRTTDGTYPTKSAYEMQFDGGPEWTLPEKVWKIWAPSHCKFFIRMMLQNRVWIADHLPIERIAQPILLSVVLPKPRNN